MLAEAGERLPFSTMKRFQYRQTNKKAIAPIATANACCKLKFKRFALFTIITFGGKGRRVTSLLTLDVHRETELFWQRNDSVNISIR